jgi:glucose-fructose oxidoreductase
MARTTRATTKPKRIRYAVIGQGYISQIAVLPAFAHARRNSELVALFSDDARKLRELGRKYDVAHLFGYEDFEKGLKEAEVDALYIALPNDMHREYTVRAAVAGVHVLCEKPMALTAPEGQAMIDATRAAGVRLMVAYRLHFQMGNLKAVEMARSGRLGELRFFSSDFSMQVRDRDNIRLQGERGGGPLYDLGIYCINAARYLFRDEPEEVFAFSARSDDGRFREVDEMTSAVLRFPRQRLATFTCSFGASDTDTYRIVGTKGDLCLDAAYEYAEPMTMTVTIKDKEREQTFAQRDQFAPELLHFSDCLLTGKEPRPSGLEGLADVRAIEALLDSARTGKPVRLGRFKPGPRPEPRQEIHRPPIRKPELVKAVPPSGGS